MRAPPSGAATFLLTDIDGNTKLREPEYAGEYPPYP